MTRERYLRKTTKKPVMATLCAVSNNQLYQAIHLVVSENMRWPEHIMEQLLWKLCPLNSGFQHGLYSRQLCRAAYMVSNGSLARGAAACPYRACDFWSPS